MLASVSQSVSQSGSADGLCGAANDRPGIGDLESGRSRQATQWVNWWQTPPLAQDVDLVGDFELQLDAASTAPDTAWIAVLLDVDETDKATGVTAGYIRTGLRKFDEAASRPDAPVLPYRTFEAVPIGKTIRYRIPLVANARRFKAGHRIQLHLASDDQDPKMPALMTFRRASVGMSCLNTVNSTSRLLLPVLGR
jgi:uncharacterized protein